MRLAPVPPSVGPCLGVVFRAGSELCGCRFVSVRDGPCHVVHLHGICNQSGVAFLAVVRSKEVEEAYAVVRVDLFQMRDELPDDPNVYVTVKEVFWTAAEAEAEADRLNQVNADKDCQLRLAIRAGQAPLIGSTSAANLCTALGTAPGPCHRSCPDSAAPANRSALGRAVGVEPTREDPRSHRPTGARLKNLCGGADA